MEAKRMVSYLKELKKICSENSVRNYGTVWLIKNKEDGTHFVATDGFRLLEIHATDINTMLPNDLDGVVLPHSSIDMVLQLCKKSSFVDIKLLNSGEVEFSTRQTKLSIMPSQVKFPSYDAVMPNMMNMNFRRLNPIFVKEAMIGKKEATIHFVDNDRESPIVITSGDYTTVIVPQKPE